MTETNFTPDDLAELRRLARSRPKSGRDRVAKLGALRVIECLEREEAARRRRDPEHRWPWEQGEAAPSFDLYVWSEVERILFGALAGPEGRPERDEREIASVVDALTAADDPHEAFRRWHTAMEARMRLQDAYGLAGARWSRENGLATAFVKPSSSRRGRHSSRTLAQGTCGFTGFGYV